MMKQQNIQQQSFLLFKRSTSNLTPPPSNGTGTPTTTTALRPTIHRKKRRTPSILHVKSLIMLFGILVLTLWVAMAGTFLVFHQDSDTTVMANHPPNDAPPNHDPLQPKKQQQPLQSRNFLQALAARAKQQQQKQKQQQQKQQRLQHRPPPPPRQKKIVNYTAVGPWLAFLHIGKAGGTSFDPIGNKIAKQKEFHYLGNKHFDWTFLEKKFGPNAMQKQQHLQVLSLLREPVERAISHYYFHFTKVLKREPEPLSVFLNTTSTSTLQKLLDVRDFWQDGQGGVSWFSGTHIASWVGCPRDQVPTREATSILNATAMMHLAATRLEQTKWFGILEDIDRSMELLQYEFQLPYRPQFPKKNDNKKRPHIPEPAYVKTALKSLMPQDMWLYDYAKLLFEARWDAYQKHMAQNNHNAKTNNRPIIVQLPQRPPIPDPLSCMSSRFALHCISGPFANTPNYDAFWGTTLRDWESRMNITHTTTPPQQPSNNNNNDNVHANNNNNITTTALDQPPQQTNGSHAS